MYFLFLLACTLRIYAEKNNILELTASGIYGRGWVTGTPGPPRYALVNASHLLKSVHNMKTCSSN